MNDNEIEQEIQNKNLNAPRLTPADIDRAIDRHTFRVFDDVLTICVITLSNGFTVTGESACASKENFNEELGRKISFGNAKDKIWMLEGYLLKQKLFESRS